MKPTERRFPKHEPVRDIMLRQGLQTPFSVISFLNSLQGRAAIALMRGDALVDALMQQQQESRGQQIQRLVMRQRIAALSHRRKQLKAKERYLQESDAVAAEEAAHSAEAPQQTTPQKQLVPSNEMVRWLQGELDQLSDEKLKVSGEYETLLHDFDYLTEDALTQDLAHYTAESYQYLITEIKQLTDMFADQISSMDRLIERRPSALTLPITHPLRPNGPNHSSLSNTEKTLLPTPPISRMNKLRDLIESSKKHQENNLLQKVQPFDMTLSPKPTPANRLLYKERTTDFISHLSTLKQLVQLHQSRTMCRYDENIHHLQHTFPHALPVPRPKIKNLTEETPPRSYTFK